MTAAASPVLVLLVSMAVVIFLIGYARVHAFFSLMIGDGVVALFSAQAGWAKAIVSASTQQSTKALRRSSFSAS